MRYKKNLEEAISRNRAFWTRQDPRMILAKIDLEKGQTMRMWERALEPGICPDYRKMFEVFRQDFERRADLLDDAVPAARPNFGDYGFGAYAGAEVVFGQAGAYAQPFLADLGRAKDLRVDPDNRWIRLLDEATRYFAEQSEGLCATSIIETCDGLNFAENAFGSGVFLEVYDHPRELMDLFDFAFELNVFLVEMQRASIRRHGGGYVDLHEEWLPGDCVWLSVDAWGSCGAEVFRRLGRGHLQKMMDRFGGGWLHMHSAHLHLLEEVASLEGLVGIGILDDPNAGRCFGQLGRIRQATGDIPLQVNCVKDEFLAALDDGTLPRGVMYWIDSGVQSVDEANRIMEKVRAA
jgi:hypothetical protein